MDDFAKEMNGWATRVDAKKAALAAPRCPFGCAKPLECNHKIGCSGHCGSQRARYLPFPGRSTLPYCEGCINGILIHGKNLCDAAPDEDAIFKEKEKMTAATLAETLKRTAMVVQAQQMGFGSQ